MNSISPNLNIMIKACEKASKILIRDFGEIENLQVSSKGPRDFVTSSDKKVEEILIDELTKYKKKFSLLSEETGEINNSDKDNIWIIDPIDGTTNFLHGIPHFAITIALQSQNEIVSALTFDPIKNEMFYAEKNNGAYFNNHRVRVSKKNNLNECLFGTNSIEVEKSNLNTRVMGSAALDLAYVGNGRLDGFFQKNLNLWDVAAGVLIITEAGGRINQLDCSKKENINLIASSNNIHDKMLEMLTNF
tara:strand:+ start:2193 stop:2933 length:741 start_codon:yes stop_codon:yes gene_type:complete